MPNNKLPIARRESIFSKLIRFFKGLFWKKKPTFEENGITTESIQHQTLQNDKKETFVENIKIENKNAEEILKLQKDFEDGRIKEEDLSKEQYESLKELYHKQIDEIKENIETKKEILQQYKNRIIDSKKKLETNDG